MEQLLEAEIHHELKAKGIDIGNYEKDNNQKVGLTISYDMGWNERLSGNRYDSLSGHCFLQNKKIKSKVSSNKCQTCDNAHSRNQVSKEHKCPRNHEGSSKSMESDNALHILVDLYSNKVNPRFFEVHRCR